MCAYALRKFGADVVVVDKGVAGGACSLGNAGWIVPCLSSPFPAPGLRQNALKLLFQRESPIRITPTASPGLARWLWHFWLHCNERDYAKGQKAFTELNRVTMCLYDSLEREGFEFEMERSGLLFLFLSESSMHHALEKIAI